MRTHETIAPPSAAAGRGEAELVAPVSTRNYIPGRDVCQTTHEAQALADVVAVLQRALVRLRGAGGGA
jgi:hypothetical protein